MRPRRLVRRRLPPERRAWSRQRTTAKNDGKTGDIHSGESDVRGWGRARRETKNTLEPARGRDRPRLDTACQSEIVRDGAWSASGGTRTREFELVGYKTRKEYVR